MTEFSEASANVHQSALGEVADARYVFVSL
jgi:hypothetical protein